MATQRKKNISSLSQLKHDTRNANRGTARGAKVIDSSITNLGAGRSIVADRDGNIIAGNKTLEAFKRSGKKGIIVVESDGSKLVVVQRTDLNLKTDERAKKLALADNRAGELSLDWDGDVLASMSKELDLTDLFDEDELLEIINANNPVIEDPADIDEAPAPPAKPKTKRGDVILLGKHRLMCGDSTDAEAVANLMDGKKADMVFTDPPYGVSIGDKNVALNTFQRAGRCLENIENDTLSPEALKAILLPAFVNCKQAMADHCSVYVTSPQGGGLSMMMMMMMMMEAGLKVRHVLIWVKNQPTFSIGRLDYDYQHEPILFTWVKTHKRYNKGPHRTSCWFVDKPRESKLHPTMKPVALVENALLNSSKKNDIVLDLFGGSGSTLIACEQTGRACRMMEMSEAYCDVIVTRWETLTGMKAKRP